MSQPHKRQPRELLSRILEHLNDDYNAPEATAKQEIYGAWADAYNLRDALPPARRSYYGARGSTRNPFHA